MEKQKILCCFAFGVLQRTGKAKNQASMMLYFSTIDWVLIFKRRNQNKDSTPMEKNWGGTSRIHVPQMFPDKPQLALIINIDWGTWGEKQCLGQAGTLLGRNLLAKIFVVLLFCYILISQQTNILTNTQVVIIIDFPCIFKLFWYLIYTFFCRHWNQDLILPGLGEGPLVSKQLLNIHRLNWSIETDQDCFLRFLPFFQISSAML